MTAGAAYEPSGPHYSTVPKDLEARLSPGVRVVGGQFEVVEELARGGMGVVYRAIDHHLDDTEVALKVVTAGANRAETAERFRNEARLGANLAGHPHVVRALSVGCLDGPPGFGGRMYLVTELVRGTAVDVVMSQNRTGLPPRRACLIARDVGRALVELHGRGIVHRDIKPGNVLLTGSGAGEHARVIDFGLAYATGDGWEPKSPDLTAEGHAPGTLLYMSPQQAAHQQPTPAFDIYSLGVMLYELFSGDPPHEGYTPGELLARKCDPSCAPFPIAKMCPELPVRLTTLVDRCMLYDPAARPSAKELVETLDEALADPNLGCPGGRRRRRLLVPAATVAVAVAGVSIAALLWWPSDRGGTDEPVALAEPSALATVAYAKSEAPEVGVPKPVAAESAKESTPEDDPPRPPLRQDPTDSPGSPTPPAKSAPTVASEVDRCPRDVRAAQEATRRGDWALVLRLTKKAKCWRPDAVEERRRLRTQALFETEHYAECAALGRGSKDGGVARWAAICKAHAERSESP